jgi:hypothetical protein
LTKGLHQHDQLALGGGFSQNGNHSEEDIALVWNRAGLVDPGYHPSHCIYRVWPSVQQLMRSAASGRQVLRKLEALVMLNVILNSMPMIIS